MVDDNANITTQPAPAQADPVALALTGPWILEAGGDNWGARANVYCPSNGLLKRKLIAVDLPLPIAEFLVEWVNVGIEATRELTPEEQEEAIRAAQASDDSFRAEAEAKDIERRHEEDEDNREPVI